MSAIRKSVTVLLSRLSLRRSRTGYLATSSARTQVRTTHRVLLTLALTTRRRTGDDRVVVLDKRGCRLLRRTWNDRIWGPAQSLWSRLVTTSRGNSNSPVAAGHLMLIMTMLYAIHIFRHDSTCQQFWFLLVTVKLLHVIAVSYWRLTRRMFQQHTYTPDWACIDTGYRRVPTVCWHSRVCPSRSLDLSTEPLFKHVTH